ncbi:MAG: hypothetical protein A3G25_14905 [Betaproteobacteria bacterium RIFCSPLOWO2_12_FULL_63_13]|nr:MAG: hypothetical protein A3G25_14905 [Betaproteobacteria bacterium RIFCSPLOWO2_12_FULL_63_13]
MFVITISLAFGATITIATLTHAIVLRTVSAPDPSRLISISTVDTQTNRPGYIYGDTYAAYRDEQRSLSKIAMYSVSYFRIEASGIALDGLAEGVTADYFELLGAKPLTGRFFSDESGAEAAGVVLSDRLRRRLFGDELAVVGQTVRVEGKDIPVVGISAPGFDGLQFDGGVDLVVPLSLFQNLSRDASGTLRSRNIIGLIAEGASVSDARAELLARWPGLLLATLPPSLSLADQATLRSQKIDVEPISGGFSTLRLRYGRSLIILAGLSVALLLIACANLVGLLLARALAQRHQVAVRLAVGASRVRAAGQILVESVVLTFAGLLLCLPLVWWTTRELSDVFAFGRTTPLIQNLNPSSSVLMASAALSILLGLAIGIVPAWRGSATTAAMMGSNRTLARSLGKSGRILLVVQVALSMIVLVGTGLFRNTLAELQANYASVQARNVVFTRLSREPGDRGPFPAAYWQTLVDELSGVNGVQSAALSSNFPTYFQLPFPVSTDRYASSKVEAAGEVSALTEYVSPGFFDTLGILRIQGRDFTWADDNNAPPVILISQSVAKTLFVDGSSIGRHVRLQSDATPKVFEIVGVVTDTAFGRIREPHQPTVFRPILQEPSRIVTPIAHVRFTGDLKVVADGYSRAIESQGRHFVRVLFTFDEFANSVLLKERMTAKVSTFIGVLIVALACIGVYSMLAFAIASRTREIGLRAALGATRGSILQMVVRQGVGIAITGCAVGLIGALSVAGLLRSQLYGVGPYDPWTILFAATTLAATIIVASLVPAFRAARVDPIEALRQE